MEQTIETITFIGPPLVILAWVLWLWLGKRRVKTHRIAILATAIPLALLVIAAVVLILLDPAFLEWKTEGGRNIADICALVGHYLVNAAILSSVVFAIMRKWEIAKGIGFGSGIGLVVCLIAFVLLSDGIT